MVITMLTRHVLVVIQRFQRLHFEHVDFLLDMRSGHEILKIF